MSLLTRMKSSVGLKDLIIKIRMFILMIFLLTFFQASSFPIGCATGEIREDELVGRTIDSIVQNPPVTPSAWVSSGIALLSALAVAGVVKTVRLFKKEEPKVIKNEEKVKENQAHEILRKI